MAISMLDNFGSMQSHQRFTTMLLGPVITLLRHMNTTWPRLRTATPIKLMAVRDHVVISTLPADNLLETHGKKVMELHLLMFNYSRMNPRDGLNFLTALERQEKSVLSKTWQMPPLLLANPTKKSTSIQRLRQPLQLLRAWPQRPSENTLFSVKLIRHALKVWC